MTVSYRKNANDVRHELVYLGTKTAIGRILFVPFLLSPLAGAAMFFFSTTPGSKAEHFAAIATLPLLGLTYVTLALSGLLAGYLAALSTPQITITIEPECFCMRYSRFLKTPWCKFQHMVDEPDFFCFRGWPDTVFIPNHAFANRAEADRFFHTALTYWHEAKGTVPPPAPFPPDLSGVWPPAPQTTAAQEPGGIAER